MIQELNVTSKIRINFKNLKRNVVLGTGYSYRRTTITDIRRFTHETI